MSVTMDDVDEAAYRLAGRLLVLVHIVDAREGVLSVAGLHTDHERLRKHGYDTSGCLCVSEHADKEPYPTVLSVQHMATVGRYR